MTKKLAACSVLMILACAPGFAFNSGLLGVEGETVFDKAFIEDYELATLGKLTPDTHGIAKIRQVLSEENKRPWP